MVTHALSARLPVFLGTKVPERNLQILLHCVYIITIYALLPYMHVIDTFMRVYKKDNKPIAYTGVLT